MKYAYVREGVIIELFDEDPAWPADLEIIQVDDAVQKDWIAMGDGEYAARQPAEGIGQ